MWNQQSMKRNLAYCVGVRLCKLLTEELRDSLQSFLSEPSSATSQVLSFYSFVLPDKFSFNKLLKRGTAWKVCAAFHTPCTQLPCIRPIQQALRWGRMEVFAVKWAVIFPAPFIGTAIHGARITVKYDDRPAWLNLTCIYPLSCTIFRC